MGGMKREKGKYDKEEGREKREGRKQKKIKAKESRTYKANEKMNLEKET